MNLSGRLPATRSSTPLHGLPLTLVTVLLSMLWSLLVISQHAILNDDAFGYLRAAELFQAGEAQRVLQEYGWYGYSWLIALLEPWLPGGLVVAAHILNTLSYAVLVCAFLLLCREYGQSNPATDRHRLQWYAAITILACPLLNEMRYFLIRDAAFWALALLSLQQILRFNHRGLRRHALWWCLSLVGASLFRLEGLLLLALTPVGLLLPHSPDTEARRQQWRRAGIAWGLALATTVAISVLSLLFGLDLPSLAAYAYRYYLPELGALTLVLGDSIATANAGIFSAENFPRNDDISLLLGLLVLLFAYGVALLAVLLKALSLPVAGVLGWYARHGKPRLPPHCRGPLLAYGGTCLLALVLFLAIMHFLTQRYATLPTLLLLSLLPQALVALQNRLRRRGLEQRFRLAFALCLLFLLVDGLISFGDSKQYIEQAIAWSRDQLPADATLHSNDMAIARGSGLIVDYDRVEQNPATLLANSKPGDYLILTLARDTHLATDKAQAFHALAEFADARGNRIRILQHRQQEAD